MFTKGQVVTPSSHNYTNPKTGAVTALYSFKLSGQNCWFRIGQTVPTFEVGDFIAFEYDEKKRVNLRSIVKGEAAMQMEDPAPQAAQGGWGAAPAAPAAAPPPAQGGWGAPPPQQAQTPVAPAPQGPATMTRDDYWKNKSVKDEEWRVRQETVVDPRIIVGAANKAAVDLVTAALANDCLALGSSKGKKLDILMGMVEQVADEFIAQQVGAKARVDKVIQARIDEAISQEVPPGTEDYPEFDE